MNQSKPINPRARCLGPLAIGRNGRGGEWALFARLARWLVGAALASALVACGGSGMEADPARSGQGEATPPVGTEQDDKRTQSGDTASVLDQKTRTLLQAGARLNSDERQRIAETGVLPKPFEGPLLSGATGSTEAMLNTATGGGAESKSLGGPKSAASRTAVYRFFNTRTNAHFFTTSTAERDNVRATSPHMTYEGPAFYASGTTVPGLSPVHRFYNTRTGVHFYTISEDERAHVAATLPQFGYEGIAYYASTLPGTGYTPLYRFFYAARGFHFYTNSAAEKDNIIATLPQYSYEGVGYYVLGSDWQTPAVPHTGITENQCYQAGSDALVACSSAGANSLNRQQDGDRTGINPMQYRQIVAGIIGTPPLIYLYYHPKTSCVLDAVTGLVWEGKEASGTRAGANLYTYYGDNRTGDVSAYVNAVNAMSLCGFNDWRVPLVEELQGIVDHGITSGPRIRLADFPNTAERGFWTRDDYLGDALSRWTVGFSGFGDGSAGMGALVPVRLVRGAPWTGPRYLVTSVHYLTDGANNAVIDRKTGLTWRRCLEGQFWTGSACTGAATTFSHANALIRGASIAGWRLPNIKELASLSDRSREIPAIDSTVFPGHGGGLDTWSSTPVSHRPQDAGVVLFSNGYRGNFGRTNNRAVHLVLEAP